MNILTPPVSVLDVGKNLLLKLMLTIMNGLAMACLSGNQNSPNQRLVSAIAFANPIFSLRAVYK